MSALAAGLPELGAATGERARQAAPSIPIDRWLVADPIAAEDDSARARSSRGLPGAATSPDLFPDRDIEHAGAHWHLVRRDSSVAFDLDSLFPDRPPVAVTYAHTYVWSLDPRTVRLRWREPTCGGALLRLNAVRLRPASPADPTGVDPASGDTLAGSAAASGERAMRVRLTRGWNTLLAEIGAGDCAYPLDVRIEAADGIGDSEAAADPLSGLRVQASRPPGVRRVYPASFLTVGDARVLGPLVWTAGGDELATDLWIELAGWGAPRAVVAAREAERGEEETRRPARERRPPGRAGAGPPRPPPGAPVQDPERERLADLRARLLPEPPPPQPAPTRVELEAKAGGAEVRRTIDLEGPGRALGIRLPFNLRRLERAARSGGVEARLRWTVDGDDRRIETRLPLSPEAVREARQATVVLDGWTEEEGGIWRGEWRVPEALAGAALELLVEETDGRWTVNGGEVGEDGPIRLCTPCSSGDRLRLEVVPAAGRTGPPRVVVSRG